MLLLPTDKLPCRSLSGAAPIGADTDQEAENSALQNITHFVRDKLRAAANPAPLLDPDHTRYPTVRCPPLLCAMLCFLAPWLLGALTLSMLHPGP